MKFRLMRRLDNTVGWMLCFFLGIFVQTARVFGPGGRSLKSMPRRVLFLKFTGIGSISRASFLLRALKRQSPNAEIVFCCFSSCADLIELYPDVDRILALREKNFFLLWMDAVKTLFWIWAHPADWVIDLEVHSKLSGVFSVLTLAKNRFGFSYVPSRFRLALYTHAVYWNPYRHVDHSYRQLGRLMGLKDHGFRPIEPRVPPDEDKRLDVLLAEHGVTGDRRILVVNPNSGVLCLERRWPAEYFAQVINHLPSDPALVVILIGSEKEKSYTDQIFMRIARPEGRVINLAGQFSFSMLLALLKRSRLLLTNDSGPLHLADVFGTSVISFWGPTAPWIYGPKGKRHRAFYRPIFCSPCMHLTHEPPCGGDNQCLKRLSWEPVLRKVLEALGYPPQKTKRRTPTPTRDFLAGYWSKNSR